MTSVRTPESPRIPVPEEGKGQTERRKGRQGRGSQQNLHRQEVLRALLPEEEMVYPTQTICGRYGPPGREVTSSRRR